MNGVSAFGVVHTIAKSQYKTTGDYKKQFKPITEMTPKQRGKVYTSAVERAGKGRFGQSAPTADHDMSRVYQHHAYSGRIPGVDASARMKAEFDPAGHTPSKVHRNIAYGPSTTPKMRARLDRKIDPTIAQKLKHPVVFHHDPHQDPNFIGAALPAHSTTHGRGHVVLNSTFKSSGKRQANDLLPKEGLKSTRRIVNHELVHAGASRRPLTSIKTPQTYGEEARADAVSGAKVYRKLAGIPKRKALKAEMPHIKARLAAIEPEHGKEFATEVKHLTRNTLRTYKSFNKVTRAVAAARG